MEKGGLSREEKIKLIQTKLAEKSRASEPATPPGKGESFLRGASQGATFGWQDEISPYIEKGIAALTGNEAYQGRSPSELRETYREQNRAAETANPKTFGIGEFLGNTVTTAPLLGAGKATTIGKFVTGNAPNVAGRVFTKEGLKILGKEGAKGALESGIMGGLQGAGSADENKVSAGLESGILNAILGFGMSSAGKGALDTGARGVKKFTQSSQALPNKVMAWIDKNPDKIELAQRLATDKNGSIADLSERNARAMSEKLGAYVSRENDIIDTIVSRAGDKPLDAGKVMKAFDKEISRLQKGGITPPVKGAIAALKSMKNDFAEKFGFDVEKNVVEKGYKVTGVGNKLNPTESLSIRNFEPIEGAQMPGVQTPDIMEFDRIKKVKTKTGPMLTAEEANILRKEVNNLASPAYQKSIGDNPVLAEAATGVGDSLRSMLDDVDDHLALKGDALIDPTSGEQLTIRGANKNLQKLIQKRQEVAKKFGAKSLNNFDNEVDPADVQKILTRFDSEIKASDVKHVKDLSDLIGVDLPNEAELVRTVKSLDSEGTKMLSKFFTGRANLAPLLTAGAGAASAYGSGGDMNDVAGLGALGLLLGGGAQSKAGMKLLLNRGAVKSVSDTVVNQAKRSGLNVLAADRAKGK